MQMTGLRRTGRPRKRPAPIGIKAAEQAFEVLEVLARAARPRSLLELSADTGMEPSKLHRYLVSLCARGMARRSEDSSLYQLGPAALFLGARSLAQLDEAGVMREVAVALSATLGEIAFIYVWSQAGPVMIYNEVPPNALISIRLGSIAPLFGSATGPVFIAFLPEGVTQPMLVQHALQEGFVPEPAIAKLRREICPKIQNDKVYWSEVTLIPNNSACAAPVFDGRGSLIGVIGVSLGQNRAKQLSIAETIALVRDAAAKASVSLGHNDEARASHSN